MKIETRNEGAVPVEATREAAEEPHESARVSWTISRTSAGALAVSVLAADAFVATQAGSGVLWSWVIARLLAFMLVAPVLCREGRIPVRQLLARWLHRPARRREVGAARSARTATTDAAPALPAGCASAAH